MKKCKTYLTGRALNRVLEMGLFFLVFFFLMCLKKKEKKSRFGGWYS